MDAAFCITSSQASAVSPDGVHVATLNAEILEIRTLATVQLVRSIKVIVDRRRKFLCLRWAPIAKATGCSNRILFSDDEAVHIWDIQDPKWSATITNGSAGMGKIANVEFGADDSQVLVFSDFSSTLTVWTLWGGRTMCEIRDPKFSTKAFGWNRMALDGTFALLTRHAAQDILNLHAAGEYGLLKKVGLPTKDAQGLKWSPDGKWLAVWDTASSGYKVLIYTADGNLYRTYQGDYYDDTLVGLGVKCVEWSPSADFLAVSGFEETVTFLTTRTFSPAVHISHPSVVKLSTGEAWQEQFRSAERFYTIVAQPAHPPAAIPSTNASDSSLPKIGTSIVGFNADGSMLVTKHDSMPTAVWIWDLSIFKCRAVLLQHAEVKRLQWHPSDPDLLLIQCMQAESVLYVWNSRENKPQVLDMGSAKVSAKAEAQWIHRTSRRRHTIALGDVHTFVLAQPPSLATSPTASEPSTGQSSVNDPSDDYINTPGKTINQPVQIRELASGSDSGSEHGVADDTFRWRRNQGIGAL